MDHPLLGLPWWAGLLAAVALLTLAAELGFRVGHRSEDPTGDRKGQIGVQVGAILALLGLMLAFSFSIVESRFSARKRLVIDEANAIGTTYLRAKLLPEPQRERIQHQLREYVRLRLGHKTIEDLNRAIARSEEMHQQLWREAATVARAHPESEVVGRFLSSLNEVIDLHTTRVAVGLHQRLPPTILHVLVLVSLLATFMLGYGAGLARWRPAIPVSALVVAIASVLVLINQLDSPGTPLFKVSQYAMDDLHETMMKDVIGSKRRASGIDAGPADAP